MIADDTFRFMCGHWRRRFHGRIPYGFALYMTPGLFELRDRR